MNKKAYTVYRIICSANGKNYVGITCRSWQKRIDDHFCALRGFRHSNSHLQRAYLKYSHETFWAEWIEKDIPEEKIDDMEIYWISVFDSYRNGFNETPGGRGGAGDVRSVSVFWNGHEYPSYSAAARELGIDTVTFWERIKKGYTCDGDVGSPHNKRSVIWNGVQYPSIKFAAKALGITPQAMRERIEKGYTGDSNLRVKPLKRRVIWNGIEYESLKAAADVLEMTLQAVSYRISCGYSCDDDLKLRRK